MTVFMVKSPAEDTYSGDPSIVEASKMAVSCVWASGHHMLTHTFAIEALILEVPFHGLKEEE